jgi:hypothetical protein
MANFIEARTRISGAEESENSGKNQDNMGCFVMQDPTPHKGSEMGRTLNTRI